VGLLASCVFVYRAQAVPGMPRGKKRKYLAYLQSSLLLVATCAGMWLLVQRLLQHRSSSALAYTRIITTIVALAVLLATVSIERSAKALPPLWVVLAWVGMLLLSVPRLFAAGQVRAQRGVARRGAARTPA
jgi:hypothetical protein